MTNAWFNTTTGRQILITFEYNLDNIEKTQNSFVAGAAKAELKTGNTLIVNEEGRRRIDVAKIIIATEDRANKQRDIAKMYAELLYTPEVNWTKVNAAISERWPSKSGLTRVKTMAWDIHYSSPA